MLINDHELIPSAVDFIIQVLKCKDIVIWDSFFSTFTGHFKPKIIKKTVKSKIHDNADDHQSPSLNKGYFSLHIFLLSLLSAYFCTSRISECHHT